jgi:methionyl-tRNA formyltransferase
MGIAPKTIPTSQLADSLVFFGTGPVACESLRLLSKHFSIEAVVTKPKPQGHKGSFPVLELSSGLNIRTFTPTNKKELSQLVKDKPFRSRVGVVIDYGIIIDQDVIDYFPFGIINSHFSLLPELRGADPITFSILKDQKVTGVSLMLIVKGLDEGPILSQTQVIIDPEETAISLTKKLILASDKELQTVLPKWLQKKIEARSQEDFTTPSNRQPSYSRKLLKTDGEIDWTKSATEIEREVRAFCEWPKSFTTLHTIPLIITSARVAPQIDRTDALSPGSVKIVSKKDRSKSLYVACGEGCLWIQRLKPSGKKEMTAQEFLAGYAARLVG